MKKRRRRPHTPDRPGRENGYGVNPGQGANTTPYTSPAPTDSQTNYTTPVPDKATSTFDGGSGYGENQYGGSHGDNQDNTGPESQSLGNADTPNPAQPVFDGTQQNNTGGGNQPHGNQQHVNPPQGNPRPSQAPSDSQTSSSHPDRKFRDNNRSSKLLNAVDQALPDDDDVAVTAIKKDGIHAPRAAINARNTSRQLARKRKQQRQQEGSTKEDGFIRKNLDRTYVATQFTDNVMPNERPSDNEGVMATRDGLHAVAKIVEIIATSEKKPKKRRLIEEETKLRHDDVDDSTGRLQHEDSPDVPDGKLKHDNKPDSGKLRHGDGENPDIATDGADGGGTDGDDTDGDATNGGKDINEQKKKPPPEQKPKQQGEANPKYDTRPQGDSQDLQPKASQRQESQTQSQGSGSNTNLPPKPPSGGILTTGETDNGGSSSLPSRQQKLNDKVDKLEKRDAKLKRKLEKAERKLPTQKVKKIKLIHDEQKKTTERLKFTDKEKVPIGEAKWNKGPSKTLSANALREGRYAATNKLHQKISQVENLEGNSGLKAVHDGQRVIGRNLRRARDLHRHVKNRHYRRYSKLQAKALKNKGALEYRKLLRDNPDIRRNPVSRMIQKRKIQRAYAAQARALKSGKALTGAAKATQTVAAVGKAAKLKALMIAAVKAKVAAVKVSVALLIKFGLFALVIVLILALFSMCGVILSGITGAIGNASFPADANSITQASVLYTELETALKQELLDLSDAIDPGDPYSQTEVFLGQPSPVVFFGNDPAALIPLITHDPIELMAFLSAVHGAFSLADVESVIQDVFDQQYQLTVETNTIGGIAVTTVTLIITPLIDVITDIMTDEQLELFELFMLTLGMGQIVASPFDFDWLPFLTSPFGFRIHPITGGKEMHLGIDIGRPTGTPLQAGVNGTVIFAGDMGGYGNVVMLLSADGIIEVRYAHMHDIFVSAGEEISIGDIIGTVGSTGMSTGPHLHLEVLVNGVHLNPIFLVSPGP